MKRVIEQLSEDLKRYRRKKYRIRRIFVKLRKMEKFWYWSDLILLNIIVVGLREYDLLFSKNEVYTAFKLVNKEDYVNEVKSSLMKQLLKGAKNKSVL